jgi:hypothetical protein
MISNPDSRTRIDEVGVHTPYPMAFENGNHGAKAKFQLSQLFSNLDFTCCTYAAKTQTPKQRPTTNWPFAPIVTFPQYAPGLLLQAPS